MRKRKILSALFVALCLMMNIFCYSNLANAKPKDLDKTIVINKRQKIKTLALSRNDINTTCAKKGDCFSVKLVEDVKVGDCVAIPSGSIISGQIRSIDMPRTFPSRDGAIHICMNKIELPCGEVIDISCKKIEGVILSPYRKDYKQKFAERVPVTAVYYAVAIPVDLATDLAGGVVYAIATGGAMITGAASGLVYPNKGQSRGTSAFYRSIYSTPIGTGRMFVANGKDAALLAGDGIVIRFENKTVQKILEQQGYHCICK